MSILQLVLKDTDTEFYQISKTLYDNSLNIFDKYNQTIKTKYDNKGRVDINVSHNYSNNVSTGVRKDTYL